MIVPDAPGLRLLSFPAMADVRLRFSSRRFLLALATAFAVVLVVSFAVQTARRLYGFDYIGGVAPLFNIDGEGNLPAWLSSVSLLACAVVAFSLGQRHAITHGPESRAWMALGVLLLLLSVDEGAQLHEWAYNLAARFDMTMRVVMAAAAVGAVVFFFTVVRHIPVRVRRRIAVAGVVFMLGAFGVEIVAFRYLGAGGSKGSFTYSAYTHFEELLEIVAVLLLLGALLRHTEAPLLADSDRPR